MYVRQSSVRRGTSSGSGETKGETREYDARGSRSDVVMAAELGARAARVRTKSAEGQASG